MLQNKIKPRDNNVLLKRIKPEDKTASGIILTQASSIQNRNIGEIIDYGPDCKGKDNLALGDKVIFSNKIIMELEEDLLLVSEDEILANINE